jgi:hypothetical protein
MKPQTLLTVVVMTLALAQVGNASSPDDIKTYFSDTACKVKAAADPAKKRAILGTSLKDMSQALKRAEAFGLVAQEDRAGFELFRTSLQAKQDELAGTNGYDRVADAQLNAFSDYVVQDMEQAAESLHISLVAALLIIIILILVV